MIGQEVFGEVVARDARNVFGEIARSVIFQRILVGNPINREYGANLKCSVNFQASAKITICLIPAESSMCSTAVKFPSVAPWPAGHLWLYRHSEKRC